MAIPSKETLLGFETDLENLRTSTLAKVGANDAQYLKKIVVIQRIAEFAGRACLQFSFFPPFWLLGTALLSLSKILDNMEIGHNVMHGQYDWMNHPVLHSSRFEWDNICSGVHWKKVHNYEHHTYTNIIGKDRDYGYDTLRMSQDAAWTPAALLNIPKFIVLTLIFQWGVGFYGLETSRAEAGIMGKTERKNALNTFYQKAMRLGFKDYLFFPILGLLTGSTWGILLGNLVANVVRNIWASAVIFCGHFPEEVQTFSIEECENESKGQWYYRQILGSCNFNGGHLMHVMSGHLSTQIEHHLFPDIPASRYEEMIPAVKAICEKYDIPYHSAAFMTQYFSVIRKIAANSLPENGWKGLFSHTKKAATVG